MAIVFICTITGHPCVGCRQDCENRAETDGDGDEIPEVSEAGEATK